MAVAMTALMFALGTLLAVTVTGSASAEGPLPSSTTDSGTAPAPTGSSMGAFDPNAPQAQFLVINGTVSASSDHEIVGSSAFPNYTTGAVDNYYSMSRSHMDNSPFSEGTASPQDTGPIGQTAAAGNFQQPQYADARWPGGPDKASYGSKGQPFAESAANESVASADASEASNGLSSPGLGGSKTLPAPKGFDKQLQKALAGWKTKYLNCPAPPKTPPLPKLPLPKPPKVKAPTPPKVTTPTATVTTPVATVTTPKAATPSTPSVSVPAPALPSTSVPRTLSGVPSPCSASGSGSDGESALTSSALGVLVPGPATANTDITKVDTSKLETTQTTTTTTEPDTSLTATTPTAWTPKPYTLMLGGESSMGRVTLGHGQIVIDGIHVTASVANDGTATPTYKANVSVASASIGGVPVTIDEHGVHVASQRQGLPYKQASDSLNAALKQAGIQIFLVSAQVTNCGPSSGGAGTTTTTTTETTTTTDQSGAASPCGQAAPMCDPGMGSGTDTTSTTTTTDTTPTTTDQSGMAPTSCAPPSDCGATGTDTGTSTDTGTTTTTSAPPGIGGSTTTTSTTSTTDTTSTSSSWCPPTSPMTSTCGTASTAPGTTTTSTDQSGTAPPPPGTDPMATGSSGKETILTATGVHVVFTQPVSPSGVPAQFVEHILGEVYIDSLAAPATPIPALGPLGSDLSSSASSSCPGGKAAGSSSSSSGGGGGLGGSSSGSGTAAAGGSALTAGTAGSSGSLAGSGSALGASSQQGSGSTGTSLPATLAAALKKPLWLLLAYLIWQALVIGTGASLWNWRRDEAP
jgi:hypothetical protein